MTTRATKEEAEYVANAERISKILEPLEQAALRDADGSESPSVQVPLPWAEPGLQAPSTPPLWVCPSGSTLLAVNWHKQPHERILDCGSYLCVPSQQTGFNESKPVDTAADIGAWADKLATASVEAGEAEYGPPGSVEHNAPPSLNDEIKGASRAAAQGPAELDASVRPVGPAPTMPPLLTLEQVEDWLCWCDEPEWSPTPENTKRALRMVKTVLVENERLRKALEWIAAAHSVWPENLRAIASQALKGSP